MIWVTFLLVLIFILNGLFSFGYVFAVVGVVNVLSSLLWGSLLVLLLLGLLWCMKT